MSGRGWGKTRTAVENISRLVRGDTPLTAPPGAPAVMSFIADTPFDMRQYSIEGPSGFDNVGPPDCRPRHSSSNRVLEWPNGCKALLFSAEDPETLRGASGSFFWWDELAKARYAKAGWSNLMFGMREGNPRGIVTTTPKPKHEQLANLLGRRRELGGSVVVTRGSTWDNRDNLSDIFYREVVAPVAGTRLGRQEVEGEFISDNPRALWQLDWIDKARISPPADAVDRSKFMHDVTQRMRRVVVAMDPAVTDGDEADEMGIVAGGLGADNQGYLLEDASAVLSPDAAARRAINLYDRYHADALVGEVNNGGKWIGQVVTLTAEKMFREGLRTSPNINYREVHASRGKATRAEPVSGIYEQGRVHHVGAFAELEDQLCGWEPNSGMPSPDRLDAVVWLFTELMVDSQAPFRITPDMIATLSRPDPRRAERQRGF